MYIGNAPVARADIPGPRHVRDWFVVRPSVAGYSPFHKLIAIIKQYYPGFFKTIN